MAATGRQYAGSVTVGNVTSWTTLRAGDNLGAIDSGDIIAVHAHGVTTVGSVLFGVGYYGLTLGGSQIMQVAPTETGVTARQWGFEGLLAVRANHANSGGTVKVMGRFSWSPYSSFAGAWVNVNQLTVAVSVSGILNSNAYFSQSNSSNTITEDVAMWQAL